MSALTFTATEVKTYFAVVTAIIALVSFLLGTAMLGRAVFRRRNLVLSDAADKERMYTFAPDLIAWSTQSSKAEVGWSLISSIVDVPAYYLLILGHSTYLCVPKGDVPADRMADLAALFQKCDLLRSSL